MIGTILTIFIILLLVGVLPVWPHSREFGYLPSGVSGLLLIVLIVWLLKGRF